MSYSLRRPVAVLGASSLVGRYLLPKLLARGYAVHAFSRSDHRTCANSEMVDSGVQWQRSLEFSLACIPYLKTCVCLAPIWALREYFPQMELAGVRRVVALSSNSLYSKALSSDEGERRLSQTIAEAEGYLKEWASARGVDWVLLRPTLVYGSGADNNVAALARFVTRFKFFPLCGQASGLRQPVHAKDVASACVNAMELEALPAHEFNLCGAETLTYREMVTRVFVALGLRPRLPSLPVWVFDLGLRALATQARRHRWSLGMAVRMNQDQVCDHSLARAFLDFRPQAFKLSPEDLSGEYHLTNDD